MATSRTDPAHICPVHVDQKILNEVLSAATGDTIAKKQTQRMQNRCKFIVQSPHHKGGYAITPTSASGLAAFYSATAKFVTLLASLPHGGAWVCGGQDLTVHDTWSNSQLQALVKAHARLIQDYKCAEWRSQDPAVEIRAAAAPATGQVPQVTTSPHSLFNQLAQLPAARVHGGKC